MRADEYRVLADCVERGVALGWNRAHKHEDVPEAESIREHIERETMNAITEYFWFDRNPEADA